GHPARDPGHPRLRPHPAGAGLDPHVPHAGQGVRAAVGRGPRRPGADLPGRGRRPLPRLHRRRGDGGDAHDRCGHALQPGRYGVTRLDADGWRDDLALQAEPASYVRPLAAGLLAQLVVGLVASVVVGFLGYALVSGYAEGDVPAGRTVAVGVMGVLSV